MTKLEELNKEYKKYRLWGYNQYDSAKESVNNIFSDTNIKPYIYLDNYDEASHIFFENQVYFFGGKIYN